MKNATLLLIALLAFLAACQKEENPPEAVLPDDVALGESEIYMNGQRVNYKPFIHHLTYAGVVNYAFYDSLGFIVNTLGFSWVAPMAEEFALQEELVMNEAKTRAYFSQTVSEDLKGYSYKLEDPEEGFLLVEAIDTVGLVVKGRFKAKFRRTSKNGNKEDLGLPKVLLMQGVFHEKLGRL